MTADAKAEGRLGRRTSFMAVNASIADPNAFKRLQELHNASGAEVKKSAEYTRGMERAPSSSSVVTPIPPFLSFKPGMDTQEALSARSSRSVSSCSSYKLEPLMVRDTRPPPRSSKDDDDDDDMGPAEEELFCGQHILWKTRQRLHIKISLCGHGPTLMLEAEVEDDLTEKEMLPRVFCDVRTLRVATAVISKANFAAQLSTRTCRGDTLSTVEHSLMEESVQRASFVTYLLRRVTVAQQKAKGGESRRSSVCSGISAVTSALPETVQLRLFNEDLVKLEDLVLQDGDERIPSKWANAGTVTRSLTQKTQVIKKFIVVESEMDQKRDEGKAAREEGEGIRTEAMDNLMQVLLEAPPATWWEHQKTSELRRAGKRIRFRLDHGRLLKHLETSKNYATFVTGWKARSDELAEHAAALAVLAAKQPMVVTSAEEDPKTKSKAGGPGGPPRKGQFMGKHRHSIC